MIVQEAGATLRFHWFLPTNGDGRDIVGGGHGVATGAAGAIRPATVEYLGQIARSAEQLGFEGALTPTGAWCEDAWLATAMLASTTQRLKFLVAFRPGLTSPTLSAQMASTFQRLSGGRLLLNVVTGGESAEQRAYGDFLDKEQRYERTAEFLDIVTRLWRGETVTTAGPHLQVEGAHLARLPDPVPDIYFGGSSHAAGPVAARYADVYLTWGEPPHAVSTKLRWIGELAAKEGRTQPRFGIRLHVITRDTAEEAWRVADRLLEPLDDALISSVQAGLAKSESEGQRRMRALHHGGDRRALTVSPNLWAGIGLVRGGAGTALVGSHTEVADRIEEYASLGISEFILSGYPHLEEAYWFGEGVVPELRRRGRWQPPYPGAPAPQVTTPFAAPDPFTVQPSVLAGNTPAGTAACAGMSDVDRQPEQDFAADWNVWHKQHEDRFAAPAGFLAITSINWLTETPTRFPDAPGEWSADDSGVTVALGPDEALTLDGTSITGTHHFGSIPERGGLFPVDANPDDAANPGVYEVARRGGNDILRPRHAGAPLRAGFHGTPAYAPDRRWAVQGRYRPFAEPRDVTVGSVVEGLQHVYAAPGAVEFEIDGQPLALTAFNGHVPGSLHILFTDATSGVTTYAANRSLQVRAPAQDGTVTLDFNRATNLPCAYTDFATCPLPPAENHLPVAVTAGEQIPYEALAKQA